MIETLINEVNEIGSEIKMSIESEINGAYDADNEVTPQSHRLTVQSSNHDIAMATTIGPFEIGEEPDTSQDYHLFSNQTLAHVTDQANLTAQRAAIAWEKAGEAQSEPQRKVDAQYATQDALSGERPGHIYRVPSVARSTALRNQARVKHFQ